MSIRRILMGCVASVGLLSATASASFAAPTTYGLLTTIPITVSANNNQGGVFNQFDISYFDPTTRLDYVADRSNAAVDVFSGTTLSQVGQIGTFQGQLATTSISGPDGVLVANNGAGLHTLFAGDGNSTLQAFNLNTSLTAPPATAFSPVSTGGTHRVDEMAYSPSTNLLLVANNADAPAYATLVNATTGVIVHGSIVIPGASAGDGLEQSVWDPNTGSFFVSVPVFGGGTDPGGVAEINTDGTIGRVIKFSSFGITTCSPAGLALGKSGNLLVGCGTGGSQTALVNLSTNTVTKISGISGSDEVYYDPLTTDFFVTGSNGTARVFDVVADDPSGTILQSVLIPGIAASVNAHSISVDPGDGDVFVPLPGGATNTLCPSGCVAVFAQNVPEPGTLQIIAPAVAALAFLGVRRRRRSASARSVEPR